MGGTKYGKYILYKTKKNDLHLEGTFPGIGVMNIDETVIKGGFYFACTWFTGAIPEKEAFKPHCHDFDEYIGMLSGSTEDPFNLNAEVEFWFDDEKHIITRSCIIFAPEGIWHGPIIIRRLDKPILCLSTAPTHKFGLHVNHDPKWSHLLDPPEKVIID